MKAVTLYRIAAVLLVLLAAGHTFGFLKLKPPSPQGQAVWDSMNNVHFQVGGSTFSYGGFYIGFGLYITLYVLFSAFLAWHLGNVASNSPQGIGALGWVFCAVQVVSLILSWKYFPAAPAIFSALLVICLGWAAWLVPAK